MQKKRDETSKDTKDKQKKGKGKTRKAYFQSYQEIK